MMPSLLVLMLALMRVLLNQVIAQVRSVIPLLEAGAAADADANTRVGTQLTGRLPGGPDIRAGNIPLVVCAARTRQKRHSVAVMVEQFYSRSP